jgi:transglutaminase-like putative cysteine protease
VDFHDNVVTVAWFDGEHRRLLIEAEAVVQPARENPFDYLITDPDVLSLPMRYSDALASALAGYINRPAHPEIDRLAAGMAERSGGRTLEFLSALTSELHERCRKIVRADGDAMSPAQTLQAGEGACRDLAVLFMDCCRSVGLAARFVSGYQHHEQATPEDCQMHAWTQVYLPGAGWRGYDPSWGLATAGAHVSVAAAAHPANAAPTFGKIRGDGARATLTFNVDVRRLAAEA